jgi:hypothetical protein
MHDKKSNSRLKQQKLIKLKKIFTVELQRVGGLNRLCVKEIIDPLAFG